MTIREVDLEEEARHFNGQRPPLRVADPSKDWQTRLIKTEKGQPRKCTANAMTIFRHHPDWQGVLAFDVFAENLVKKKPPPFDVDDGVGVTGFWTDADTVAAQVWLCRNYGFELGIDATFNAIQGVARCFAFHPVKAYLEGLVWDGIDRLSTWTNVYAGVQDTTYSRAVGRCFLIGAVARIMRPGCKLDTMLVLEGAQGTKKSTLLRVLASDAWFVELSGAIDPKETPQQLRGKWIAEFGELASFKRTKEVELIKSFLSRTSDNYRPPYGRIARDFPRATVFTGSTNDHTYLQDATGGRRFLPLACATIAIDALVADRDQLWAEAVLAYLAEEPWYLQDGEALSAATLEQEARFEEDVWTPKVIAWLKNPVRVAHGVSTGEVLGECLGIETGRFSRADATRVGTILRYLGWEPRGKARPRKYHPE